MSHTSTYKFKLKNHTVLKNILEQKGIEYRENCVVNMYGRNNVNADLAFKLPGWQYECAVTKDGTVHFDHWGSQANSFGELGSLVQEYNKEAIIEKVYNIGKYAYEETLKNGSILLTVEY